MNADDLRQRLGEIDEGLREMPADAFADRHVLLCELDECRTRLRSLLADDLAAMNDGWAERAGRKGEHSVHEHEQTAAAVRTTRGLTSEGGR